MPNTLQTDFTDLRQSRLGAITGRIWFVLDGEPFPDATWSDFPVVLLGWWIDEIHTLEARSATQVELCFMDGPFAVVATAGSEDVVHLEGWRRGGKVASCLGKQDVRLSDLRRELLAAGDAILARCDEIGFQSADVDRLAAALRAERQGPRRG